MTDLAGARIAVAGAGVFGLVVALTAAWRGAEVVLYDPRLKGDRPIRNASWVAAGMLAPAFEAALDDAALGRFELLRSSRDRWPALMERLGLADGLDRSGALMAADAGHVGGVERAATRLAEAGAALQVISAREAQTLQPALASAPAAALYSPEDWRIDPRRVVPAMLAALQAAGGEVRGGRLTRVKGFDAVVLAPGAEGARLTPLAPELSLLSPIKGQILHLDAPPSEGPVLRFEGGYVAPQSGGAVVGATMEAGVDGRRTTAAALQALRARAAAWMPHLARARGRGSAGVRAATPDGLPLAGSSARPGVFIAAGARRNGWLLAPLVAEVTIDAVAGRRHADAALFAPERFNLR